MANINSVWSAYGHRFMHEDGYEACLTCGAKYKLVETPDAPYDGEYVNRAGDEPRDCTRDTSMTHGLEDASDPNCNCCACAA